MSSNKVVYRPKTTVTESCLFSSPPPLATAATSRSPTARDINFDEILLLEIDLDHVVPLLFVLPQVPGLRRRVRPRRGRGAALALSVGVVAREPEWPQSPASQFFILGPLRVLLFLRAALLVLFLPLVLFVYDLERSAPAEAVDESIAKDHILMAIGGFHHLGLGLGFGENWGYLLLVGGRGRKGVGRRGAEVEEGGEEEEGGDGNGGEEEGEERSGEVEEGKDGSRGEDGEERVGGEGG
ncbi:hypothetical protein BHE74_00038054 [Ensete ventricosum]|nr:hypothetical protein BHE74_00038054 [Ensete ventricosum]